ncbi:hypothetical protein RUND412_005395 [Rhizina undulata]
MYSAFRQLLPFLLILLPLVKAVFKDEAYQNDWHIPLLGPSLPTSTFFHRPLQDEKASLIYVLTSKSILAAINPKDGEIVWRQSLGGDGPGIARASDGIIFAAVGSSVKAFDTIDGKFVWGNQFAAGRSVKNLVVAKQPDGENDVAVLFDDGTVRKLSGSSGDEIWEWKGDGDVSMLSSFFGSDDLVAIYRNTHSTFQPIFLDAVTGKSRPGGTVLASESFSPAYISETLFAWTETSPRTLKLYSLGGKRWVSLESIPEDVQNFVIHTSGDAILIHYQGSSTSWVEVYRRNPDGKLVKLHSLDARPGAKSALAISKSADDIFFTWSLPNGDIFVYKTDSPEVLAEYHATVDRPAIGISHAIAEVSPRANGTYAVRTFASTYTPGFNGDSFLVLNGDIAWERKESLSTAVASTWVELLDPAAEEVAEELGVEGHQSVGAAYLHRIIRHIHELLTYGPDWLKGIPVRILKTFSSSDGTEEQKGGKWRDFFGYRKYVVVATAEGGLAAIDIGRKGEIAWQTAALPVDGEWKGVSALYEVGKGLIGVVTVAGEYLEVDAFEGTILKREKIGGELKSTTVVDGEIGRKVILAVLDENKVVALPHGSQFSVDPIYLVLHDTDSVKGLRVTSDLQTQKTWTFTPPINNHILSITSRPFHDPVASIGKVLGDRSVMYKYLNPHLIAILSVNHLASTLSITLIDSVSGAALHTTTHTGVDTSQTPIATLAENWLVYTYFGDNDLASSSAKGQHLVVSEFFESEFKNDRGALDTKTHFSSVNGEARPPFVLSQSYIFAGGPIVSLSVTATRQGITSREILALLKSGAIAAIPKRVLDPRRPVDRDPNEAEREEGLFRYSPVIEVDPKSIINHKRELVGIKTVVTAPALLESTSLVFAFGGDLFATRVSPSLAFDVLGKGFSRVQLVGTIVALAVGVGFVAPMVRRKQINQRWIS